jgi:drug/metabolite transporter (DMT)-like permease
METSRQAVDSRAALLMALLCSLWGLNNAVAKLAAPDLPLTLQGGLRAALACALLMLWSRLRGQRLFDADGSLWPGLVAGVLFAGEFLFIYAGLEHTAASRIVVFVYLSPVLTAVGVHWLVPGERLGGVQWVGVLLAFLGIVAAFGEGFVRGHGSLLGDSCGVIAALLWASTTVWIRRTRLGRMRAGKVLFYQLAVCAALMLPTAFLLGEKLPARLSPLAWGALAFQGAVVAFASYLAWFWLLTRYRAGPISVFGFLTPLFGVVFGAIILDEVVTPAFIAAVALVGAGIALVNRRS